MDDRELLDEFVKARSQSAFRELVARHLPVVYSAARRMVRDSHLAEEVAQSVFTTLAQKAESIRPPQLLGGWLYNTTRHLAMHAVRTEVRRREREQTAYAMQALDLPSDDPGIAEHLEPAMAELDAEDRDALVLRYLANRGLREVGAELGVSEEAARKRVSRALERLRTVLETRGVTATGVLLATALTASTLAVPIGLGATVATTALTGISVQTSTAIAVTKVIAMTTLQKTLAAAALVTAVSLGVLLPSIGLFWPSRPAQAANSQAALGWVQLGKEVALHGLVPANQQHDGVTEPSLIGGIECHSLQRYPGRPELYAYFRIDPALKSHLTNLCIVEVEYFDEDSGAIFRLDYDSYNESSRALGAYTQSKERVHLKGTQRWRRTGFLLDDACFEGRQNDQADFRVTVLGSRFFLRSVKLLHE